MARVLDYGKRISNFRVLGEGKVLGHGVTLKPAPYLPIVDVDTENKLAVVIKKGTFVTFDQYGYLVPAKKVATTLTYTATDVEYKVFDIDSFTNDLDNDTKVSAAKTSTATLGPDGTIKTYFPIGILALDAFQYTADPWFKPQDNLTLIQDSLVLVALDSAHESQSYEPGSLLVLDDNGYPIPIGDLVIDGTNEIFDATQLNWAIGRLVKVIDLEAEPEWKNALDMVIVPPVGQPYIPGSHNSGVSDGFDVTTKKALLIQLNTF